MPTRICTYWNAVMLNIQEVKCPNCGSPAGVDDDNCNYCFARIPRLSGSSSNNLFVGVALAFGLGLFAADWYLGIGIADWVIDASQQTSD